MPLGYLEKLFIKQRHWESGDVGANCLTEDERISFFQRQQFVLQFFLGYLKIDPHSCKHHCDSSVLKLVKNQVECNSK